MGGPSLLAGQLTGVLLIGTIQAMAFLAAGLAAGVEIQRRPLGCWCCSCCRFRLRRIRHNRAVRRLRTGSAKGSRASSR